MPCPPSIAQWKQTSLVEGLRNTWTVFIPSPSFHRTAEASIAGGGPHSHIVAPTPSLTAEANVASGEPVDLLAAESRRLMLVMVHTHRSSDSASSIFSQLTMYADPLAERV